MYLNSIPTFDKQKPEPSKPDIKPPETKQENTTTSRDDKIIQLYKDGYLEKNDFMALMGINNTDIVGYV